MSHIVLLPPDAAFMIIDGAQKGVAGFGLASDPNLSALLYDPSQSVGSRISILNNLTIPRKYYFEATVLPDGRVLLSGPPNVWTTRVLSAPSLRRQMCRFRLQDGTNISFLMARHHHVACLFALVVIPQSSVTDPLFLALISLVFEPIRKRYSCFEIWCPCQKSTGLR